MTKGWAVQPDMPTARYAAGCGVVTAESGKRFLVAAGGKLEDNPGLDSTDIYDIKEGKWTRSGEFRHLLVGKKS